MSSLTRPIANRAVHLRIHPRPSSLGENREILRLLSRFGEIEYYKSLKYDRLSSPATALVIYAEDEAAKECLTRSPIRFRMGRRMVVEKGGDRKGDYEGMAGRGDWENLPRGPVGAPFGLAGFGQTREMSTSSTKQAESQPWFGNGGSSEAATPTSLTSTSRRRTSTPTFPSASLTSVQPDPDARIFQIITNPSTRHFRDIINHGHYHGTFAMDTKMFGQADMARRVPLPALSLLDWRAEEVPWHIAKRERMWDHSGPTRRRCLGEIWREAHGGSEGTEGDGKPASFSQFTWSEP